MFLSVDIMMRTMAVVCIICCKETADGNMMSIRMMMGYNGMRQQSKIGQ